MNNKSKSTSVLARVVLGAFLAGAPATAALASEGDVTTAESADAMAQHYREQAAQYRALGGVGYKSGRVREADASAARYQALAEQLRGSAPAEPQSAQATNNADLAAHYRALGGVGYKSGLVQRAEAQQQQHEPQTASSPTTETATSAECTATKPVVVALLPDCAK